MTGREILRDGDNEIEIDTERWRDIARERM